MDVMGRGMCVLRIENEGGPTIEYFADEIERVVVRNGYTLETLEARRLDGHIWKTERTWFVATEFIAYLRGTDLIARYPYHEHVADGDYTINFGKRADRHVSGWADRLRG